MFYQIILTVAVLGLIVNSVALVIIGRKKRRTMFHDLLIILTASDIAVVICCAFQFALPSLWEGYSSNAYPHILQFLLPVMHITVMISVYTTILISFERFVRICFYCQLRETSILSEENIKFYKCFVILFPVIFYIPKFFEVRSHHEVIETQIEVDCQKYILLASYLENPFLRTIVVKDLTPNEIEKTERLSKACSMLVINQTGIDGKFNVRVTSDKRNISYSTLKSRTGNESKSISKAKTTRFEPTTFSDHPLKDDRGRTNGSEDTTPHTFKSTMEASKLEETTKSKNLPTLTRQTLLRNITRKKVSLKVIPTALRKNEYYYKIYYVYLNTIFASILPLALLLFLNISTAIELIKMSRQESQNLPRNTSKAILPPRTSPTDYSDKGISMAQSVDMVTEIAQPQTRNTNVKSEVASLSGSNHSAEVSLHVLASIKEDESSICCLHKVKYNNNFNIDDDTGNDSFKTTGINDIRREAVSSRNEFLRRSTMTQNIDDPVVEFHTSANIDDSPKDPNQTKRSNFDSFRKRFRSGRRPSLGRDKKSLSNAANTNQGPSFREKKKELRLVRISLCIVWLFIFCHIWKLIPTFYTTFISEDTNVGFDVVWPDWLTLIDRVSTTFITLNSSLNFLIYVIV